MIRLGTPTSIVNLCKLYGKSRQAYYSRYRHEEKKGMQEAIILDLVRNIRSELPYTGVPKLHRMLRADLAEHGIFIGRDRLANLLRSHGLMIRPRRKKARTTWSSHRFKKWKNLVTGFTPRRPEQLWVSDITYIRLKNGFSYLSLITDAYSRKIMGFHMSRSLKAQGTISALNEALRNRMYPGKPLIHHSDRGIQYCCDDYVAILQDKEVQISMTQRGDPTDNPIAERINGILKKELGLGKTFASYRATLPELTRAIYLYNEKRLHSSVDYLTPSEAHKRTGNLKKHWKKRRKIYAYEIK